ncbi:MAG: homoserine O-acetyltransferase MetX [Pseudomonadales bacterium]
MAGNSFLTSFYIVKRLARGYARASANAPKLTVSRVQTYQIPGTFALKCGELTTPHLAYETWGELNAQRDNAVFLFTGLSPSAHAASSTSDPSVGWWEDMVGPDKPIDSNRFFIVCMNSLGSCFGSTGPASEDPATGQPYRLTFPVLSLEDIACAAAELLDHLGVEVLHSVVGASMGGMTALAFSMLHPERTRALISISSAARSLPFSIALRSLQRELIWGDAAWENGNYPLDRPPVNGMRLARKLGMISYRSATEWDRRFGRERAMDDLHQGHAFGIDFEVESYLQAHANRFVGSFDPNCYLYLSRAMDLFDTADHGGSLRAGLARVTCERVMIIGVETDILFPMQQQQELAAGLRESVRQVTFHELNSIQGHDSFLVDMDQFRPPIAAFFES